MPAPLTKANLDDSILLHLRADHARLPVDLNVGEALQQIRSRPPEGRIVYFYVVDDEGRLQGVVPTRRLLLSDPSHKLSEIMERRVIAIPASATVLDACEFFTLHRLLGFPVVDPQRRLLGVVDVELYTDEVADLARPARFDDLFQLIGVHVEQTREGSPWNAFRSRFPWLLCNIGGGIAAAFLSGFFQETLDRQIELVLFIPVVLTLAESVAIQSLSLTIRGLHGGAASWRTVLAVLRREVVSGALIGLASGLLVGLMALIWKGHAQVAGVILASIGLSMMVSAVVGALLPTGLALLRRDPRVAAGPIALVVADLGTLLVYFSLAARLLR